MSDKMFSIITPSYRGAEHLIRLYHKLEILFRMDPSFEWILVDDCSNDDGATNRVINIILKNSTFQTRAIFLAENYYGSRSTFEGARLAVGEYSIILDQDDELTPQALNSFRDAIRRYSDRPDFAGVCGRCINSNNQLIGAPFWNDEIYSSELKMRHLMRYRGEFFQCTKTALLIRYFAEMLPGYTNGYVWIRLAQEYSYAYINCVVRKYNTENPASVSNSGIIRYVGNVYRQSAYYLEQAIEYISHDPFRLLVYVIHCKRFEIHALSCGSQRLRLESALLRKLLMAAYPIARTLVCIDRIRNRVACN